jgi:hypothetical protein
MMGGGVGVGGSGSDHPNGVGMRFGGWEVLLTQKSVLKLNM